MTSRAGLASVCAGIVVAVSPMPRAQSQTPSVFRSGVSVVSVDVSVSRGRQAVTGLSAADFVLIDNGVAQQIDAVTTDSLPVDVTLLLDVSGSVRAGVLAGLTRAVDDISRSLGAGDRVRLLTFSHVVHEVFPYRPGGGAPDRQVIPAAAGSTSMYDALAAALMRSGPAASRQMILVFTDGADSSSFMGPAALKELAGFSDAVVQFAVGLGADVHDVPRRDQLESIAAATGGAVTAFRADSALPAAFRGILQRFRTGYVLRYTPTGVSREGWHAITVRTARDGGYTVRARKGYRG